MHRVTSTDMQNQTVTESGASSGTYHMAILAWRGSRVTNRMMRAYCGPCTCVRLYGRNDKDHHKQHDYLA